jgi:aromatic ring-opening dioxygenase LigB subunit
MIIDISLVEEPIDVWEEIPDDSMVIFDDTDDIDNKKVQDSIDKLKKKIMAIARAKNVYIVITSHNITPDSKKLARAIMTELSTLTFFPKAGSPSQIEYVLDKHVGMRKQQIKNVMDNDSRWVTILRNYPQCVFTEKEAYMLHADR